MSWDPNGIPLPSGAFPTAQPEEGIEHLPLVVMIDPPMVDPPMKFFPKLPKVEDLIARHDHRPVSYLTSSS